MTSSRSTQAVTYVRRFENVDEDFGTMIVTVGRSHVTTTYWLDGDLMATDHETPEHWTGRLPRLAEDGWHEIL